ncbi:hypothetical protein [Streptomyces lateritius]|uniref:hypothetical protein n=1 Tax=Streptomyces lateritius TaxID=67313 RepID=UPI001678D6FB|nr:hypothetical protein [Streptomyces lateritius]GGU02224.1 hypothetical protein GCM10010272_54240 [Streptomyces lateritius]
MNVHPAWAPSLAVEGAAGVEDDGGGHAAAPGGRVGVPGLPACQVEQDVWTVEGVVELRGGLELGVRTYGGDGLV